MGSTYGSGESLDKENVRARRNGFFGVCTWIIIHLFIMSVYTAILFSLSDFGSHTIHDENHRSVYSPAQHVLKWEPKLLDNPLELSNPFKGPPRPELDDAWNTLLGPTALRVDKEVLDRIGRTSVPLSDGSGHFVGLDVYHQLHCLKYIRKYVNPEYYNLTEKDPWKHVDHCLESVRQYVMCNADVSLLTYDWIPNFHRPWPNFEIVHECANWDYIESWAWEHSFDGFDKSLLNHPDYHPELDNPFHFSA